MKYLLIGFVLVATGFHVDVFSQGIGGGGGGGRPGVVDVFLFVEQLPLPTNCPPGDRKVYRYQIVDRNLGQFTSTELRQCQNGRLRPIRNQALVNRCREGETFLEATNEPTRSQIQYICEAGRWRPVF